ncbi:MAG: hypothetical protein NTY77_08475, partial [Elusimicrobia bacterium]|nr:hypothetical protein [Elusimicrobiota bacterium]
MSEPPAVDLRRDVKSLCAELLAAGGAPEVRMLAVLARVFPAQASARGILDPKLGVYSEGFFLRLIESELSGTAEAGLIVFRSERVEEIRREKGEDVAAQVLGRLAEFLRPRQAVAEWLGRVGPDSLGLLLPQVGILTAQERAQTLYEALRRSSRFPTSAGVSHTMDLSGGAPELVRLAREAAQATRDSGGRQPRTLTSRGPVAPPVATAPPAAAAPAGPTLAARYQRLVLLNRMSLELFADQPFSEALLQACSTILALTQANYAAVHFCDEFGQPFCAVRHGEGPAARTEGHAEEARLVARVLAERRILSAGGRRGWSAAPLLQNRPDGPAPLGAVVVGFPEPRPPDPELDQTLLEISRLLRNARLTQQHLEHQQVLA